MKTLIFGLALCCITVASAQASSLVANAGGTAVATNPVGQNIMGYQLGGQAANQNVWQKIVQITDTQGHVTYQTNDAYTELETGLNHLVNGQWVASKEEIDISADGNSALTTNGQHQAYFPGNIYSGQIELVTPEGKQLFSRPVGLDYFDGTNSVLIAELTNSTGEILPSGNQVLYANAFTDFKADIRYTYTKAGFEQDIILREQPPTPASFGLNPNTTRLQVLTEFFNPPQPTVNATTVPSDAGSLENDNLDFGVMQMTTGKAFLLGTTTPSVAVNKQWLTLDGRQMLVEEVPVVSIATELQNLPLHQTTSPNTNPPLNVVSAKRLLPEQHLATIPDKHPMQMAQITPSSSGLVLDYVTMTSQTNYTFQGDTTYYISGTVNLYQTNTFEGGAVLKYTNNASVNLAYGSVLNWKAAAYRPVILTAIDDNSVGNIISGSTGSPTNYYANPALNFLYYTPPISVSYFRIAYASQAISLANYPTATFYHGQIVNCLNGITGSYGTMNLRNLLFANVQTNFNNISVEGINAQNTTFSGSSYLVQGVNEYTKPTLTNCILANVTNLTNSGVYYGFSGAYNGFYNSPVFGTSQATNYFYPFQSVGAGNYYLTNGCAFTNAGTTSIDPTLLASLAQKTTYPPLLLTNQTVSANTTLNPQAQRDTNAAPSLGYHYDPIDYIADLYAITNATLTVTNGTAIASYNEAGVELQDGSAIVSIGSPLYPNWFVIYTSVQEQSLLLGGTYSGSGVTVSPLPSSLWPTGQFSFSKFACPANGGSFFGYDKYSSLLIQDCEFWSGTSYFMIYTNTTVALQNNLFDRSMLMAISEGNPTSLSFSNNLIFGTTVFFYNQSTPNTWQAFNNAFDSCGVWYDPPYTTIGKLTNGYNAYLNCYGFYGNIGELWPTNASDIVTNPTMAYQTGPLGSFYQPTNSPLINMGSTNANLVGLYHYTTTTNEMKETNSIVDIGYHYVATGTNGNPIDTDGDGIPDYLEDANGDGVYDSGDPSDWTKFSTDGTGMSDSWEIKYFGHIGIDPNADPDGDGLDNLQEYQLGSNPTNANTFNMVNNDALYFFTALAFANTTKTRLGIENLGGGLLEFSVSGGGPNATYDLYYVNSLTAQRWQWRRVYTDVQCDNSGNAIFIMEQPDLSSGFFVILSAADSDGDGLTDGYEAWFNYNGHHTETGVADTDGDGMSDGWEVEYGLDPTSATGNNGASGNPDGDAYVNLTEYQNYSPFDGSYDPLEPYGTSANRPVVSIIANDSMPSSEQSSFTIYRYAGNAADYSRPLTVYYAVGGTLSYDVGEYTLNPAPPNWPRIYSATIPAGQQSVIVTVDAPGVCPNPGDVQTVAVSLTPYSVAANPQVSNPLSWAYVVDWQNYNRATITYENQNLRPNANSQSAQTCHVPVQITLSGYDNSGANLTFSVVSGSGPNDGSLSSITPINGNSAHVTYTPNGSFCGRDSFSFIVNDGVRNSAPATVTIDVGDPNPTANVQNVMIGENTPGTLTLSGSDICGEALTFETILGFGPNNGTLGAISQIDNSHASITYSPNNSFEGVDQFDFSVNNCAYGSTSPAQVTVYVVEGPQQLTAQCNLNQIVLNWTLDSSVQQMEQNGLNIYDFQIYRSTTQGGPYTLIGSASSDASAYVDMNATYGTTYYYVVTFRYQDPYSQTLYQSPYSGAASASPCSLPPSIRPGFNQQILAANDDNLTGDGESGVRIPNQAAIGFPIMFFGTTYSTLFVNNNGNVTFNNYLDSYTPEPLSDLGMDVIAPFWADVDTRGPGSGLVTYGQGMVNGHTAFAVNWVNVGYYRMLYDKLNSFQLVLINRSDIASGDFDMEFNYESVKWEAGQADYGIDGLCGSPPIPPRAGYAAANGTTFELNGSGITGAFLDSNPTTGLIYNYLNNNFPGRYLFSFRNGTPGILPAAVFNPAGSDTLPVTVTLSVPGYPNASIYYTSDGTTPTTASTLYSGPINVTANETLNAIAVETGWGNSEASSASFGSPAPVITTQPSDQTTTVGGNATFTVVANGLNPLQYQWMYNGNVVGTEATLSLQNVQQSDSGTYDVIITDPNGNPVQSSDATLTVTGASPSSPTININSPVAGNSVNGTITVQATSQGTDPTVRASLWVDGNIVANQWFGSPYSFTFDTTTLPNGNHQLQVKTYDLYNNEGTSTAIDVNVNNLIYDNSVSAEAFIPNGDDSSARSITFSANFATTVNWTLTISGPDGTTAATFNGSGVQMSQNWSGSGATDSGQYSTTLTATHTSQSQTVQDHFFTIFPAPDWNNVNNINYHAYAGDLDFLGTWNVLSDYVFEYLGLSPATMVLPADVFTYENRIWETLFGYDGDQVVNFSLSDLLSNIKSDNVCYILTHGFGTATAETELADSYGETIESATIYGANYGSTMGYMFVQINACNSGTYQDAKGNNDMAIAFGIANSPITYRRAYLGWSARFGGDLPWANPLSRYDGQVLSGPATLYEFDQLLWNDLYTYGMTVQDAVADAYASAPQPFAVPIIYGDPSLILPQLF